MPSAHRSDLLIVTPHSSGALPPEVLRIMLGADAFDTDKREAFLRRVFLEGDPYTDLIFNVPNAAHLSAPWSRFAADLNRERDDESDNGVLKLFDFARSPLYPSGFSFSPEAREARLRAIWDPFEAGLSAALIGKRLLIVGHSMAPYGPSLGPDTGKPRPGITLMLGTPAEPSFPAAQFTALQNAAEQAFAQVLTGETFTQVAVNDPWSADAISVRHARQSGAAAFGIEVNAGLYLTPDGQVRPQQLARLNAAFEVFADSALAVVG
ncbi:N-formylglutamate amidohydrolase (plasmid) [Deinococcus psychrotolerans]|uniref:N-formylglutamate amidohydrolase n=1 Tax=Deinococcus psychrotolerans TaxID=2489213 RepID=A0A3G8YS97_9DEIO|nr:N-formylglutamate amidohydrolase [Deinococcus psychrotolerans]AZI44621.1 N-formylglutamate amidohydrolase [Deinococcus psychrotolerans]